MKTKPLLKNKTIWICFTVVLLVGLSWFISGLDSRLKTRTYGIRSGKIVSNVRLAVIVDLVGEFEITGPANQQNALMSSLGYTHKLLNISYVFGKNIVDFS